MIFHTVALQPQFIMHRRNSQKSSMIDISSHENGDCPQDVTIRSRGPATAGSAAHGGHIVGKAPRQGCVFFTDVDVPTTAVRFNYCATSSVGCAAPKAIASPTSKFYRRHAALRHPIGHVGNEDVTSESIQPQALRQRIAAGRQAVPTSTHLLAMCCSAPCERRYRSCGI